MNRSLDPELMDSPDVAPAVREKFHRDLDRVHGLLGTFATLERYLRKDDLPVRKVMDIGSGGGALLRYLRRRMNVEIVGVDLMLPPNADYPCLAADACRDTLPQADVAVTSFVAHHLTPEQNIRLIRNVARSCRRLVILDLVRHPLPLMLFSVFICPLIGREAAADGRQSIRRAFTPEEFSEIVARAVGGSSATFVSDVSLFRSRQIIDIHFG